MMRRRGSLAAAAVALVLIVACVQMPEVERLPWQADIFGVQLPEPVPAAAGAGGFGALFAGALTPFSRSSFCTPLMVYPSS